MSRIKLEKIKQNNSIKKNYVQKLLPKTKTRKIKSYQIVDANKLNILHKS